MSEETKTTESKKAVSLNCIYAVKAGMSRVFTETGENIPVTVLDLRTDSIITQIKTKEKDGYTAVQVGFLSKKAQRANKAEIGHFKKVAQAGFYHIEEFRLAKAVQELEVGAVM